MSKRSRAGPDNLSVQALLRPQSESAMNAEHSADLTADAVLGAPADSSGSRQVVPARAILPSRGEPLGAAARAMFEPGFARDLSAVRVHPFPAALAGSRARAVTLGTDIAFAPGQYAPQTSVGQWLLAHEIAHVVQQSQGDVRPQANGELTENEIQALRDFVLEANAEPTSDWARPFNSASMNEQWSKMDRTALQDFISRTQGWQPLEFKGMDQTGVNLAPPAPGNQLRSHPMNPVREDDSHDFMKYPFGKVPPGAVCGTSIHRTTQEIWDEKHRRAIEDKKKAEIARQEAEKERRRAAWEGLHKSQHQKSIEELPGTLREDIETTVMTLADLRLKMFDRALQGLGGAQRGRLPRRATEVLRNAWVNAQRTTIVLDALLPLVDQPIPPDITQSLTDAYREFYGAMLPALRDRDLRDQQTEFVRRNVEKQQASMSGGCHGGCGNQAKRLPKFDTSVMAELMLDDAAFEPQFLPAAWKRPDPLVNFVAQVGQRETLLIEAMDALEFSFTKEQWGARTVDFRRFTSYLDEVLLDEVKGGEKDKELVEQFDYARKLEDRQRRFQRDFPQAKKIKAIFYPRHDTVEEKDDQGLKQLVARGIPYYFYLTQTHVVDESKGVPIGFEWKLHDITAGYREQGKDSVKVSWTVDRYESYVRSVHGQTPSNVDPPHELFEQLNHSDFFPNGILYFRYPNSGKLDHVVTDEPWTLGGWLKAIGLAVAILSMFIFAPMSAAMFAGMALGSGLSIAGGLIRHQEKADHGVLAEGDTGRLIFDIALDVLSVLTFGASRAVQVAAKAGNALRAAKAARVWFVLRGAQYAGDVANIGIMIYDVQKQYQAIMSSKMTDDEKQRALLQLTFMSLLSGAISILPLRSMKKEIDVMDKLLVDIHPRTNNLFAQFLDATQTSTGRGLRDKVAKEVPHLRRDFHSPDNSGIHSHKLLDDGTIKRCSEPCELFTESLAKRIVRTMEDVPTGGEAARAIPGMLERARVLQERARLAAEAGKDVLERESPAIFKASHAIEEELGALRDKALRDTELAVTSGADEAFARYGDRAMSYKKDPNMQGLYQWVYTKEAGLEFRRRSRMVPHRDFNPKTGEYGISKRLFPEESATRLGEIETGSVTHEFKVKAEVKTKAELDAARPNNGIPPKDDDWVVTRITEENAHQFADTPVRWGELRIFPEGSRAWRTKDNIVHTDSPLRPPPGRMGGELLDHPQLGRRKDGTSNEGVPVKEITGVDHQRSHVAGNVTGFELVPHIPMAPTFINQELQNRGIEMFMAELAEKFPGKDLRKTTAHELFPRTRRQQYIEYTIDIVENGKRRHLLGARIDTSYVNKKRPGRGTITSISKDPADIKMLLSIDMPGARKELDDWIKQLKQAKANLKGR